MRDEIELSCEGALLLRPVPRAMQTGEEAVRFGGRPRLPESMDWPRDKGNRPLHFLAEIDFARLPREIAGYPTPAFPEAGSLILFLPLSSDGLYCGALNPVVFTPEDVTGLPEREPPGDTPDIRTMEPNHVHEDGTMDDGRLLVRQIAEVLPFRSERAANPLALNMAAGAGADTRPWERAHRRQEEELARVLREARPFPASPSEEPERLRELQRIPKSLTKYLYRLRARHLTWEFIFDWSKEFYRLCHDLAIDHLEEIRDSGDRNPLLSRAIRRLTKKRANLVPLAFGKGRQPIFFTFEKPVALTETFDWQARRWIALSQFEKGLLSPEMLTAFVDMLVEFDRHARDKDASGNPPALRVGLLDHRVQGHGVDGQHALHMARKALERACARAVDRQEKGDDGLTQDERWDQRIVEASKPPADTRFCLGTLPPQMFGLGFEIQSAVTEHADDVLLFQLGDSFGLPLEIGPDMILQLWISPEDLAAGVFDRVTCTLDMT